MTDDNQIGDTPSPIVEKNVAQLNARVLILEALNEKLIEERDAAVKQLKQANDLIEADTKARLVKDASECSMISLPELAAKDIDELETIISVSKLTRKPTFQSGADIATPKADKFDSRTYLHSLYVGNKKE